MHDANGKARCDFTTLMRYTKRRMLRQLDVLLSQLEHDLVPDKQELVDSYKELA